jgi:hypothetical protein
MDIKFNSLFDDVIPNKNLYSIDNEDNIGLDPRIKENSLILNNNEQNEYHKILEARRFGNLPVAIISGRPCSASLCTSNKFCESSGRPEILYDIPLTCENDYYPQGQKANQKRYIQNIDVESRLLNMDYKVQNESCSGSGKEFKEKNLKSLDCFKNTFFNDTINFNNKISENTKLCNVYIDKPAFDESTKRIDAISW